MQTEITISNTSMEDWEDICWLFQKAMELQGKNGYKVWEDIDYLALENEITNQQQFKIVQNNNILCLFSIQFHLH
jgi:hypothetical protein